MGLEISVKHNPPKKQKVVTLDKACPYLVDRISFSFPETFWVKKDQV